MTLRPWFSSGLPFQWTGGPGFTCFQISSMYSWFHTSFTSCRPDPSVFSFRSMSLRP